MLWDQGDGKLLYYGDEATGPVASMRLVNLRDGFEDYDYIALLRDLNATAAQQALEDASATSPLWSPQRNGSKLSAVREYAAAEIEAALRVAGRR